MGTLGLLAKRLAGTAAATLGGGFRKPRPSGSDSRSPRCHHCRQWHSYHRWTPWLPAATIIAQSLTTVATSLCCHHRRHQYFGLRAHRKVPGAQLSECERRNPEAGHADSKLYAQKRPESLKAWTTENSAKPQLSAQCFRNSEPRVLNIRTLKFRACARAPLP